MKQIEALSQAVKLLFESPVWPDRQDIKYFNELVFYAHRKGWLWLGQEDGEVKTVAIGYRVKDADDATTDRIPEQEEGDLFYIPILVSKAKNKRLPLKMLRAALKRDPKIKKVHYHKTIGVENGKEERARVTERAEHISGSNG